MASRARAYATMLGRTTAVILGAGVFAVAAAELVLRLAYGWIARSTERFPLLYERVYWAVPPWVHHTSVMYGDEELGRWMKPHTRRTYINLYGPIGDLADVGRLFESP